MGGNREIDILKEAAQRAEKSKLAAQHTTEEMVSVLKSLRVPLAGRPAMTGAAAPLEPLTAERRVSFSSFRRCCFDCSAL